MGRGTDAARASEAVLCSVSAGDAGRRRCLDRPPRAGGGGQGPRRAERPARERQLDASDTISPPTPDWRLGGRSSIVTDILQSSPDKASSAAAAARAPPMTLRSPPPRHRTPPSEMMVTHAPSCDWLVLGAGQSSKNSRRPDVSQARDKPCPKTATGRSTQRIMLLMQFYIHSVRMHKWEAGQSQSPR